MTKLLKNERGDTLVEFAVVAIVLFTCIFGIMDCSRALYAYHFTSYAAREATRYATVRGSTWGSSCSSATALNCGLSSSNANILQSYIQSITPAGINPSSLTVTSTWPGTAPSGSACNTARGNNSPGCLVEVQVSYSFNYITVLLPTTTLVMKSTSEVTILQ